MKTRTVKTLLLGFALVCACGFALAADNSQKEDEKPEGSREIVAGSPHRSPELMGLPHIKLSDKQENEIEEIVQNNQEGVVEVNRAVLAAEKALARAKQAGRPKFIELAAFELGQVIGDRAILNLSIVNSIKDVLNKSQLEALEEFNLRTQRWLVQGKLSTPEKPERLEEESEDEEEDDKDGDEDDRDKPEK